MFSKRFKYFMLYAGIDGDEFETICPMIWRGNLKALRITTFLSCGLGAIFLIYNLVIRSGNWAPYLFLMCGSLITLGLLSQMRRRENRSVLLSMLLCYGQMILVCVYAGFLSTRQSNYDIPATSVIVFISLLPLSIDDRPVRMFTVIICESAAYLVVSYMLKSPHAFSLDVQNAATFCIVGMVLYSVICTRNVKELYESVRIERIQKSIIASLATVVEERDDNTGEHIVRTESYVEQLINKMKKHGGYPELTKKYCENVILASSMHDIGKIRVPDRILNKPGKLTEDEYEIMKKHSASGADIIKRTISDIEEEEYCKIACNIARYHHERYDGTGYPDGLARDEIPLEARIMALADVYDALISERVYKAAFSKEKARRIIEAGSGTQFDPELTALFLECL